MPIFNQDGIDIRYEEYGNPRGFPVLLLSPGGMNSTVNAWATMPWDPRKKLKDFRVIAMDQRNAGKSKGPLTEQGWVEYAADQLALLEYLHIDAFHAVGMCIGGPYVIGLAFAQANALRRGVLLQPIGLDDNRQDFYQMFDRWKEQIKHDHPEATAEQWEAYKHEMFGSDDFLFCASEDDLRRVSTPLLVLHGNDLFHPASVSQRIVANAPNVTSVVEWKTDVEKTDRIIQDFLRG